jgi:hypothetical protein
MGSRRSVACGAVRRVVAARAPVSGERPRVSCREVFYLISFVRTHLKHLWPNCARRKPILSVTLDQPTVTKREMAQILAGCNLFNC